MRPKSPAARARRAFAAIAVVLATTAVQAAVSASEKTLTPQRAIETARFMDDSVSVSPDGARYAVRLVRGDVARNGYWLEVIAGRLDSSSSAPRAGRVARLFSSGLGSTHPLFGPDTDNLALPNPIRWVGSSRIAFFWSDQKGVRQIVTVDLDTGRIDQATHAGGPIASFDITSDGTVVYNEIVGRPPEDSASLVRQGFAIKDGTDGFAALQRHFDGLSQLDATWNSKWFVRAARGSVQPIALGGRQVDLSLPYGRTLNISPNARMAIVSGVPATIPAEWDRYSDAYQREIIRLLRTDATSFMARRAVQLYVVDTFDGHAAPLWRASAQLTVPAVWSPDSRSVLLAPTFLPADEADSAGLDGRAAAVVDVSTGKHRVLPVLLPSPLQGARIVGRWLGPQRIEIEVREPANPSARNYGFVLTEQGGWHAAAKPDAVSTPRANPARVEIRQTLVTPPALYATDVATGREEMIFDPNPDLADRLDLGRVERLSGQLPDGTSWSGLLFHPVGETGGRKFPLVIQSSVGGIDAAKFTLYGWQNEGLGPPSVAIMAGQLLTQRQMAVLTISVAVPAGPKEGPVSSAAYEAAARQLVGAGLVDQNKVGLVGFSRAGFRVQYALTHSSFPFAAAIAGDNFDSSYIQSALRGFGPDGDSVIGAPAFGAGLQKWLTEAPGFNADRIRAPLLMIGQTSDALTYILAQWEMFSRLRHLGKPVEMYLMPDIDRHPSHSPQNPVQILAVQGRAIDWLDFWLNGNEDPAPAKGEQYAAWRRLRDREAAADGTTVSAAKP